MHTKIVKRKISKMFFNWDKTKQDIIHSSAYQSGIQKKINAIMHTHIVNCNGSYKRLPIAIIHTNVQKSYFQHVFEGWIGDIQMLSFAIFACKSYRSSDANLRIEF